MDTQTIEKNLIDYLDLPKNLSQISFPKFEVEEAAKKVFQLEDFHIQVEDQQQVPTSEVSQFFENNPYHVCIKVSSIQSEAFFLISNEQINLLSTFMLENSNAKIADENFLNALFLYALSRLFTTLAQTGFTKNINIQIQDQMQLPNVALYDLPITLRSSEKTATCHFAMTPAFQKEFFEQFRNKAIEIPADIKRTIKVPLGLEIGSTELNYEEVKNLANGDFILLDRCTFDPETKHGNVSFMLGEKSLFRGKIKENEIKILDIPFETIGENSMEDLPPFDDNPMNQPPEKQENPPSPEPTNIQPTEGSDQTNPAENTTPPLDETKPAEEAWTEAGSETPLETPPQTPTSQTVESAQAAQIAPSQIPLNISVEVSRIQMSVDEFLQLQPGQTLQLGVPQDEGVDLIVGGKKLAKGELIKIQDLLGVRITKIFS